MSGGEAEDRMEGEAQTAEAQAEDVEKGGAQKGKVHLVGAGPGDPGLMTARALQLIAEADVVLYDKLIPESALEGARQDAELLFVGKEGGGHFVPQEDTERLLIAKAREGLDVVRLKGGDPFVFGRGGEEALTLREEGIEFDVVPGVTAGVAAPAFAGIPVTHRGLSTAVAFITGHTERGGPLDWEAIASFPGTLIFYMGVRRLGEISEALIAAGRRPSEPAAIVERGTLPDQRLVRGELSSIADVAEREQVKAPSITVIGEVSALSESLTWRGSAPLRGVSVAVTRARPESSGLARRLKELGAEVVQAPAIRIDPLPTPLPEMSGYDLLCLTSPNGVRILFEKLFDEGRDCRALSGMRIAAIGPGTARALKEEGIVADVVPERFVAEGLIEALEGVPMRRALIARASKARELLPEALRERGAEVDVLPLYETVSAPIAPETLEAVSRCDYVTFTSSSTVTFFLHSAKPSHSIPSTQRIVSIGPVTSETLRAHGLKADVEAERHDVDGLIEALLADVGP